MEALNPDLRITHQSSQILGQAASEVQRRGVDAIPLLHKVFQSFEQTINSKGLNLSAAVPLFSTKMLICQT